MKKSLFSICIFLSVMFTFAEQNTDTVSFDFVMQDIKDIIYAVSLVQGVPMVCDDTVTGKTSFRFSGTSFEKAGEAFLLANRLYARLDDGVIILTKIHIEKEISNTYSINAYDISPAVLLNKISETSHIPITYDLLPVTPVSLHVKKVKVEEAVSIIMRSFPGYSVQRIDNSISISKDSFSQSMQSSFTQNVDSNISIQEIGNSYSLDITSGSFFEAIEALFSISQSQFSNLMHDDRVITRIVSRSASLEESLNMLCSQAEASYTFYDDMYIIYGYENARKNFINSNTFWKTIRLKYIRAEVFVSFFKERFSDIDLLILSDTQVQIEVSPLEEREIDVFLALCDVPYKIHHITLQYITTEKFLLHLPPGLDAKQFSDLGTGHDMFFSGSEESFNHLQKVLTHLDKPSVIIGYDLLVLQVQESDSFSWRPSLSAESVSLGDKTQLSGHLGSVFALNLDVVSVFGYTFAAALQTAIVENKANVYVDTTLQGISGSPIHFQNTNTYRYQDTAIDPDSGKPVYSGVTREIIAGFVLSIEGWVSGDGMVTTKVTASLSRRGADVSESGNPPATSEKIVTTEVRGKSGEPIILSGLVQNDSTFVEEASPFLSKIPIIGWFFKSHQKNEEKTEMIIYLVPHVESLY